MPPSVPFRVAVAALIAGVGVGVFLTGLALDATLSGSDVYLSGEEDGYARGYDDGYDDGHAARAHQDPAYTGGPLFDYLTPMVMITAVLFAIAGSLGLSVMSNGGEA